MDKRQIVLKDVFDVGPDKPLGFVEREKTAFHSGRSIEDVRKELEAGGLRTLLLDEKDCMVYTGALYAWHEAALQVHLDRHEDVLAEAGWPLDTEGFVRKIAAVMAPWGTPLCDMIADAFADRENGWRSGVAPPLARPLRKAEISFSLE